MLDQLPRRAQTPPTYTDKTDSPSSSLLAEPVTPFTPQKLHKQVVQASVETDRRASKVIRGLYDQLAKTSADLVISKPDNEHLEDSLTREKRQRNRKKKVLEQLRSDGQTAALFMSPSKVQKTRDILLLREQE